MTRPAPTVTVPVEPMPEMIAAWYRVKNGHHFHGEPAPTDTSDYAAYRAMLAAAPAAPQAAGVGEAGPAEREVGRAVYERIEKLIDTDPRGAELDYLSHLAESVEEVGGYDGPLTPLRAPSREPEGGAVSEGELRDAITLILPMAKGYAAAHPVGSNQSYVDYVEGLIASHEEAPADRHERNLSMTNDELIEQALSHPPLDAPAEAGEALHRLVAFIRAEKPLTPARAEELGRLLDEADRAALTPKGSGVSQADLAALERVIGVEYYAGSDGLGDSLKRILAALRAQPQAREDAQPVAWTEDMERERREADYERGFMHGKKSAFDDAKSEPVAWRGRDLDAFGDGAWAVCTFKPSCDEVQPLYTHPAPDALRVAVGALEKIEATPRDRFQVKRMKRYAAEALAALQAERKGGA